MNPFAEHYVPDRKRGAAGQSEIVALDRAEFVYSQDLRADIKKWQRKGCYRIGSSEYVERGNRMGISHDARAHALAIGASVVVVESTPAKLRAIRRTAKGTIDMATVLADPPAVATPRGYYVVRAIFMRASVSPAKLSEHEA
jgi:hypothetical protein